MKLKYRLRRFLFPRKHSQEVRDIRYYQLRLKVIQAEIDKINQLATYGYLGDVLWDRLHQLTRLKSQTEKNIFTLYIK